MAYNSVPGNRTANRQQPSPKMHTKHRGMPADKPTKVPESFESHRVTPSQRQRGGAGC